MNQLSLPRLIARILMISIIFTSFPIGGMVLAEEPTQTIENMNERVQEWLNSATRGSYNVETYKYKEDGKEEVVYAICMPKPDNKVVGFNANTGAYVYYVKDANDNVVDQVEFYIDVFKGHPLPAITEDNYEENLADVSMVMEMIDRNLFGENRSLISEIAIEEGEQVAFAIKLDDGTIIKSENKTVNFENPRTITQSLWELITNAASWLWDVAVNKIGKIFNDLLLWIADGIQDLINSIFGYQEDLTVYKVIFGKIDKLSINYWANSTPSTNANSSTGNDPENPKGIVDNAPAPTLKNVVSYWYAIFRGIVIAVYLVMLLYIGIRILLSSTGKAAQKYKESLTAWVIGVIILTFYPYVMRYTIIINNALVEMIDNEAIASTASGGDTMLEMRKMAEEQNNIALTIVYIIMLGQLVVLLGVYYKRAFMIAFLITIFPIVAGLFIWEKAKGGSKALSTWTKEYVILVLTQTFHAVVYVVLIDGALKAFNASHNWFILILSVTFLFEAEKIIRAIFGMKSSAGTIGDLASTGVATWAAVKTLKEKVKLGKEDKNAEDEKNAKGADEQIAEAKKQNAVNLALAQTVPNMGGGGTSSAPSGAGPSGGPGGSGGPSGSGGSGGPSGSAGSSTGSTPQTNPMDNLQTARAFASQDAFKKRTKRNVVASALTALPRAYTRAAGITLGMTSGLATGSVKDGIANAAIGNEFASMGTNAMRGIAGWTFNQFAGKRMKAKILSGEMDASLKDLGFDLNASFDNDPAVSAAKAQIIREALAAQADATRKGGKVAGELAFMKAVEKGRKREHL